MAKKQQKTQSQIITAISERTGMKKADVKKFFDTFSQILTSELKQAGICVVPGVARVKAIRKPATKARQGRNPATGEEITIKAKPARTVVKAYPVKALKEIFV